MKKHSFNLKAIAKAASIISLSLTGQFLSSTYVQAVTTTTTTTTTTATKITGTPLTAKNRFEGKVDYVVTGGTLRQDSNSKNACTTVTSSTAKLFGIPKGGTVQKAYLYWTGSGKIDSKITLNNQSLIADKTYQESFNKGIYFQGVKDVTSIVQQGGNQSYTFTDLTIDSSATYCNNETVLGAWAMVVIYEDPAITKLNTINLYEGFKKSAHSAFDYTLDGIKVSKNPKAKYSVLSWEGDHSLGTDGEYLQFNGQELSDKVNPNNNLFNSSINSIGKGADTTYGVDFDTFDVSKQVTEGQTAITGTVGTGQDLVMQGAALVMVTDDLAGLKKIAD
jgi:hypothetical protein